MPTDSGGQKHRGPYNIGAVSTGNRNADLLRDPEVAAFVDALSRVRNPHRRALVEWLVRELSRQKKEAGGPDAPPTSASRT
jgi:hypothetical protein